MSTKVNHFGEIATENISNNYGHRGVVNCTINAPEVQHALRAQREAVAERVAQHEGYRRGRKHTRTLTKKGDVKTVTLKSGSTQLKETVTQTTRRYN